MRQASGIYGHVAFKLHNSWQGLWDGAERELWFPYEGPSLEFEW